MLAVLRHPTYARLFAAQVVALVGTGLLTVALGLLAFEIAGADGGLVLGIAMTVKILAYVLVAPLVQALVHRLPRKAVLIGADAVRALAALALPFITEAWQIYLAIAVLQAASATFTPTFQSLIPEVLPEEADYTKALSLSRLAYDLEALLSPAIAALLLGVLPFSWLFAGTVVGFAGSALLVAVTALPQGEPASSAGFAERVTAGTRMFFGRPALRVVLAIDLAVAAVYGLVMVNTTVTVRAALQLGEPEVGVVLAAFGLGSMAAAFLVPRLVERVRDLTLMTVAALAGAPVLLLAASAQSPSPIAWPVLLVAFALAGATSSLALTPAGRILRRATTEAERPAAFAAQFSLSHACYLIAYPVAGFVGAVSLPLASGVLATMALVGGLLAVLLLRAAPAAHKNSQ
ncbi:MFS transporter [Agrococcus beijingensis]|uniref:MFS transporter n=1 Tax=Agrococcus beijingensis TaxID=3068634 RepID=UPI002740877E|nr:MFS transporter [Agrococcus sp. REN33]